MQFTRWQSLRMAVYLFGVGLRRRMILGVRAALIEDDRVLLIRQTYMPGWQFPGGGVEPGETAEFAAARELFEETGYRPASPMSLFGLYHNVNPATNRDHIALYVCRDFQTIHAFKPNMEIGEAGWFQIDALPEQTLPGTHRRIDEIFRGAPQDPNW